MPLILRYVAFVVSWAAFSLAFTLLFLSMRAVLAVGGYCAEGGPYVIQTHCPDDIAWMAPVSVYLGLAAVALNLVVARGLGASLALLAWPTLFIGLSLNFLQAGFEASGDTWTAILLGGMFFLMGAIPFVAWMIQPGNAAAAVAGTAHLDGRSVGSVNFAFRRVAATESGPGLSAVDFTVLVPLWLASLIAGVVVGYVWFMG